MTRFDHQAVLLLVTTSNGHGWLIASRVVKKIKTTQKQSMGALFFYPSPLFGKLPHKNRWDRSVLWPKQPDFQPAHPW